MNRWTLSISCAMVVAASGCGEPDTESESQAEAAPPCSVVTALSPIGAAVNGVPGVAAKRSTCASWPTRWLYNIDGVEDPVGDFYAAARAELENTVSSFSHAALLNNIALPNKPSPYEFAASLATLNTKVHTRLGIPAGGVVPAAQQPIVRFFLGSPGTDAAAVYQILTASLPSNPATWGMRVAVKANTSVTSLQSWNHSKLSIRDRIEVISSSFETSEREIAMRIGGDPASRAQNWFDVLWLQPNTSCAPLGSAMCPLVPTAPAIAPTNSDPVRSVNVFALERGGLNTGFDAQADESLLAGLNAARSTAFFLNPGLIGIQPPVTTSSFSFTLVNRIADRVADGLDVKFVWGGPVESPLTAPNWQAIEDEVEARFAARRLPQTQRDIGHCMFHLARYADTRAGAIRTSHAKFYMLDRSFYIGSQNLYPPEFEGSDLVANQLPLQDFGFLVDTNGAANADLADQIINRIVNPTWTRSAGAQLASSYATCSALHHPVELVGTATTTGGTFTCSSDFNLNLNFRNVTANQIATASGSTTCSTAGVTVAVTISGVVVAGGRFDGTITGLLPDRTGDTAALTGTLSRGVLLASFSGLEPIRGVPYSGTVATRSTTCDGLARSTCTGSCAWYNCAHRGAGGCFPTGTPNAAACPPADQATCAAIHTASACTFGCSWYACANHGTGGCFSTGTPNATACPVPACSTITTAASCTGACAWYLCANRGAGGCFPTGTPNPTACPPPTAATCAAIHTASACTLGCSWYLCANHGAGGCFLTGTPNATACP